MRAKSAWIPAIAVLALSTPWGAGAAEVSVKISQFAFAPAVVTVSPGDTVVWTNEDGASHSVKGPGIDSPVLRKGDSFRHTFEAVGGHGYQCGFHHYMQGTVVVE